MRESWNLELDIEFEFELDFELDFELHFELIFELYLLFFLSSLFHFFRRSSRARNFHKKILHTEEKKQFEHSKTHEKYLLTKKAKGAHAPTSSLAESKWTP